MYSRHNIGEPRLGCGPAGADVGSCEWPDAAAWVGDIRFGALFYKACNNVGDIGFDWRGKGD